jgi:hypothetical protein
MHCFGIEQVAFGAFGALLTTVVCRNDAQHALAAGGVGNKDVVHVLNRLDKCCHRKCQLRATTLTFAVGFACLDARYGVQKFLSLHAKQQAHQLN